MSIANEHLSLNATVTADGSIHLTGSIKSPSKYYKKYLLAANPIDRMLTASFLKEYSSYLVLEFIKK